MSTNLGPQTWDPSSSTQRFPPKGPNRKPPPSSLALSSSAASLQSHLQPPNTSSDCSPSSSASGNIPRNSLDSSRSDLTSVRSDITSLRVSEFPLPPSALPTIPASPKTPISITFSSTTPRSQSPQSGLAYQQQHPSRSPARDDFQGVGSPFADQQLGYDPAGKEGLTRYSQYAVYKESNSGASMSRPATPTTAGTITPRDWPSSSGRSSPALQPPRPAYAGSASPVRSHSPLRNGAFAAQQEERHGSPAQSRTHSPSSRPPQNTAAQPPRSVSPRPPRSPSPQPPRAPLPVAPRDSTRYSHIDMGMDITEEQLLSTDFISELLNQPPSATSSRFPRYPDSPRSARFPQYPDSPRSAGFPQLPDSPRSIAFSNVASDETEGLSGHIGSNEIRFAHRGNSAPSSPGFSGPVSVSGSDAGLLSPLRYVDDTPGLQIPELEATSSSATDWRQSPMHKLRSGLASSVWPGGGDRLDQDFPNSPSLPVSPNVQSLSVPEQKIRSHASPHPLVPSTPMTPESFAAIPSPTGAFARAQAKHLPQGQWRTSSTSHSLAAHLPIGAKPSGGGTQGTSPSRIIAPRIRQHHYPRHGIGKNTTSKGQISPQSPQGMTYPPQPASEAAADQDSQTNLEQESPEVNHHPYQTKLERESPEVNQHPSRTNIVSTTPSALSFSSSIRTQRNSSIPSPRVFESEVASPSVPAYSNNGHSPGTAVHSRRSLESSFQDSTETEMGDDDLDVEVQVASRAVRPTVIGLAPAVFFHRGPQDAVDTEASPDQRQNDPMDYTEDSRDYVPLDSMRPASRFYPEGSPPASPRDPPSVHSPPSHRTDMPESVKSMGFSEDPHGQKSNYLPFDEIAGYGSPNILWNTNPKPSLSRTTSRAPLSRRPSNKASSFKSVVSYMTTWSTASRVSKASHMSAKSTGSSRWAWLRKKPLPPLPTSALESQNVWQGHQYPESLRRYEAGLQLPDLAQRAGDLRSMLEQGSYAAMSKVSLPGAGEPQGWSDNVAEKLYEHEGAVAMPSPGISTPSPGGKFEMIAEDSVGVAKRKAPKPINIRRPTGTSAYGSTPTSNRQYRQPRSPKRQFQLLGRGKRFWILVLAAIVIVVIISAALAATLGKHKSSGVAICSNGMVGARCNLDVSCTCPSQTSQSGSDSCSAPLAQALVQVVPVAAQQFATNITVEAMALAIWDVQGTPVGNNCSSQAVLIDVGSGLDETVSPNRTQWAQAALLWTFFQSRDLQGSQSLQSAVQQMPWESLSGKDGPEADPLDRFDVSSMGSIFNFANQTVRPVSVEFQTDSSPTPAQLGEVNDVAGSTLDRMYSFASASSTLQQTALQSYWRTDLSLDSGDLSTFLAAFKSAPILLPFDATVSPGGQAISDLLAGATNRSLSFPPPIACYPGLSSSQVQRISAVETQAFGLPPLTSSPSNFDSSCFANRPVYGVLDVLHMQLPFSDDRTGVAKQAAMLTSDASTRAVLHVGELLSALPAANDTTLSPFALNPRSFGTLNHVNHIALAWLQSFPNTSVAAQAAQYVLSSPSSPPSSSSGLSSSTSIPIVEVAVFGNILLSDISGSVSNFSTPSGGLFFGSSQGDTFRRWALQQSSSATITWSPSAFSTKSIKEGSSSDPQFDSVWSQAMSLISKVAGGSTGPSDVNQIVNAFFGS